MCEQERWKQLIENAERPKPIGAHTFRGTLSGASDPVVLACDDGLEYVVKGGQSPGRVMVTEQIVGRLGIALGAPVPRVSLVNVPGELIATEPKMRHMPSGVSHGSLFLHGCLEADDISDNGVPENQPRYALLAVLYGWIRGGDRQFLYQDSAPQLVWSVDHGNFFPDGPNWTLDSLLMPTPEQPDRQIMNACHDADELAKAIAHLRRIDDVTIAEAVAAPPDEWNISPEERIAVAQYLVTRRDRFRPPRRR